MKHYLTYLLVILPGLVFASPAGEADNFTPAPIRAEDILPVEEAFRFGSYAEADGTHVFWQVMQGYYLYRDKFGFVSDSGEPLTVELADGEWRDDEVFGRVRVLEGLVEAQVPTLKPVTVQYQGCAEQGFCYPPQKIQLNSVKNRPFP